MGKPLISTEQYKYLLQTGRSYDGYVWTKEGKIYYATYRSDTVVNSDPPFPHSSIGTVWWTVFLDVVRTPEITEADLGDNDVLYTENGDFVTVIESDDPVAGEIKILKNSFKYKSLLPWNPNKVESEDIVGIEHVSTLTNDAYSKIFTHILSLMEEVDLNKLAQKRVISLHTQNFVAAYNRTTNELKIDPVAGTSVSYLEKRVSSKTVWNIQNMLGAHEYLGHKEIGWKGTWKGNKRVKESTHYLAYLFQTRHQTWKKATEDFKKLTEVKLNDEIRGNVWEEERLRDNLKADRDSIRMDAKDRLGYFDVLKKEGWWPDRHLSGQDSIRFFRNVAEKIQNPNTNRNPFKK
jgi:hypothetical protein